MEPAEPISEEWSSLSGLYTAEETDFMTQLLSNCSASEELYGNSNSGIPSVVWPGHESTIVSVTGINNSSYFPSNVANSSNFFCLLQGCSSDTDSSNIFLTTSGGNCVLNEQATNFGSLSVGFSLGDAKFGPCRVQGNDHLTQPINENTDEESCLDPEKEVLADRNILQANMNCEIIISEPTEEDKSNNRLNPAKRSRSSKEVSKNKRNVKSKKNSNYAFTSNDEEERSPGLQLQSSSSCSSEDDSSASQELNGGASRSLSPKDHAALKLNGKSRATKGPATDPQSLYARRRRERINERLRILQNLVPNGTKVDISTMLEEAVQYVKFLQLQIKLLSSDDLWMYAPIAYNGMNIGLGLNISPN